jgi:hydrogenase maturation factor
MELKKIEGEWGIIVHENHEHKVSLSLIEKPRVGDWILAHGDLAVSRIPKSEAKTILDLIKESGHTHNHSCA